MTGTMSTGAPPGVPESLITPTGNVPAIGIGTSQDYARLIFAAPYFDQIPIAEIIQPSVTEAVENVLPSLVPPYVDAAVLAGVQQYAVLLTGSTMTGPLFLSPLMPTADSQAATKAYVDTMLATAGIPEVPPVPVGQVWARMTGQWTPIDPTGGNFLPIAGGAMQGNINMSGNTITNMAAVPAMPNGAAPAQWVLNQIASVSLYQGTWDADTNTPDLTQLSTHVNGYTWIAITTSVDGVVIGAAIPGLQGLTIYNGDTIIYSTAQGQFSSIHAGGLSLPEADARYVQLAGSQMSGALLLNANASQPLQAVTYQQLQAFVPPGAVGEAPNDGQLYGRNGLTASWAPVLPLAGGILTGSLTLAGNATANLNPVPLQQMTSAITAGTAGLLPIAGGTMTGPIVLASNASANLNPVPLQQLNSMLATYATQAFVTGGFLALTGGTISGSLGVGTAPPSGAQNALVLGGASGGTVTADNFATNAYYDGTTWRYLATGNAFMFSATPSATAWAWYSGGSGSAGAAMSFTTPMNLSAAGALSTLGSITSGGNVTAGTGANHIVQGGGFVGPTNQTTFPGGIFMANAAASWQMSLQGTAAPGWRVVVGANVIAGLDGPGNLTITGTLTQGSDATGKENISPITQGLSIVRQLLPKSFQRVVPSPRMQGDPEESPVQWGFIAQDIEPVLPPAVNTSTMMDGTTRLGLDTTAILAAVTNAVKQLDERCVALESAAGITPPADALA